MTRKAPILIPFWVQEALKRKGLQLAECLNFEKMKEHLSLNDLVTFYTLQRCFPKVIGADQWSVLWDAWFKSIPSDKPEVKTFLTDSVSTLAQDESFQKEVHSRLFCEDSKNDVYKEPFITYDLTPEVLGVVVYPGFFVGTNNTALQKSLLDAILKVLYVYEPYHEVAKTPLFKRYLDLLSGK